MPYTSYLSIDWDSWHIIENYSMDIVLPFEKDKLICNIPEDRVDQILNNDAYLPVEDEEP